MTKIEMTEMIITAKTRSGLSWQALAEKVGLTDVFLTSACLGMNSLQEDNANKLCETLQLPDEVSVALQIKPLCLRDDHRDHQIGAQCSVGARFSC